MAFPLIPVIVGLVVAGSGTAVYFVTRERKPLVAARGPVGDDDDEEVELRPIKAARLFETIPAKIARIVKGAKVEDLPETAEEFAERYTAIYMRWGKCVDWKWGFPVRDLMDDAMDAGGAQAVTSVMSWIGEWTGIDIILKAFNFLLKFRLWQYLLSDNGDGEGATVYLAFSVWSPIGFEAPDVPIPIVDGYTRAWVEKKRAQVYGIDTVYRVILPKHRGGSWAWLVTTTDLRTALRTDKINPSTIRKHQCGDGSTKMVGRAKAKKYYR